MNERIIEVFYDNLAYPFKDKELTVRYPIVGGAFMGASNTTHIKFYIDNLGQPNATWVAIAKLPNGKKGSKVLETASDEKGNYALLELSSWFTQAKGDLFISLNGYQGGIDLSYNDETGLYEVDGTPIIEATGSVKINIAYATQIVGSDEVDEITLQSIYALLGTKLDTDKGIVTIDNTSVNVSGYENGQVFFSKADQTIYKLVSGALVPQGIGIIKTNSIANGTIIDKNKVALDMCYVIFNTTGVIYRKVESDTGSGLAHFVNELEFINGSSSANDFMGRSEFYVVLSTGAITSSTLFTKEFYNKSQIDTQFYNKTQADNKFASLNGNNTFKGTNTFENYLPQSEVTPTNGLDLINLLKGEALRDQAKAYTDEKIAELQAKSDVIDVLGNIAELEAYNTEDVAQNDIINVLSDTLHENASTFYKLRAPQEGDIYVEPTTPDSRGYVWVYIGEEGPFLTPNEADNKYQTKIIAYPLLNIAPNNDEVTNWVQDQDTGKWHYVTQVSSEDLSIGANDKYLLGGNDKNTSDELAECNVNIDSITTSGAYTTIDLVASFSPTKVLNVSIVIAKVSPTTYSGITFITTSDIDTDYLVIENNKLTVSNEIKDLITYAKSQGWID